MHDQLLETHTREGDVQGLDEALCGADVLTTKENNNTIKINMTDDVRVRMSTSWWFKNDMGDES